SVSHDHAIAMTPAQRIWMDGAFVDWKAAQIHILTHTLHYGLGVFEGIRAYKRADGRVAVFRLRDHINRLFESCHICTLEMPFSREQIIAACLASLRENPLENAYLRPIVFLGGPHMGLGSTANPVQVAIPCFSWGAYLGDEALRMGIRAKVSSF